MEKNINVLVTNDDGIDASGIKALVAALSPLADVYVAAPQDQQSAKSHGITFLRPIKPEKRDMKGAVAAYAVDGTPVDCVKWGLSILAADGIRPDYVFSGINLGMNTGLAAYYSGTVAAAREGALSGIPSIALSVGGHAVFEAKEFEYITGLIPVLMGMTKLIEADTIINVNAPELPAGEVKGYKVLEAAPFGYGETYDFVETSGGEYQMLSHPAKRADYMKYDFDAVEAGYAAISPIPTSMTDRISLSRLQNAYAKDEVLTVMVDAQEDVVDEFEEKYEFERKLSTLAHCIGRMDLPILLTQQYGKGAIIGSVKEYASRAETVERVQIDPWFAKDMERHMGLIESKSVIIGGAGTHAALMQMALGFLERGYEVCVIEDCCASENESEHRRAIKELAKKGCRVTSLETEIMRIAGDKEPYIRESVERIIRRSRGI